LEKYVTVVIENPTYLNQLQEFKKEMANAKRMVLDGVQDHIILYNIDNITTKEIWAFIMKL